MGLHQKTLHILATCTPRSFTSSSSYPAPCICTLVSIQQLFHLLSNVRTILSKRFQSSSSCSYAESTFFHPLAMLSYPTAPPYTSKSYSSDSSGSFLELAVPLQNRFQHIQPAATAIKFTVNHLCIICTTIETSRGKVGK